MCLLIFVSVILAALVSHGILLAKYETRTARNSLLAINLGLVLCCLVPYGNARSPATLFRALFFYTKM